MDSTAKQSTYNSEHNAHKTDDELLWHFLPDNSSRQESSLRLIHNFLQKIQQKTKSRKIIFLDLGCGTGSSYDQLAMYDHLIEWVGLDILSSPEVDARNRKKLPLVAYDGVNIPFRDASVDIVYTHQVFEHIRYPAIALAEIKRILKPGGLLMGSTSHLEPYHSHSFWNYTPYGFAVLLNDAGLNNIVLRPGIDGVTLIVRRLLGYIRLRIFDWAFEHESPLNMVFEVIGRLFRINVKRRLAHKLLFSGHFVFSANKSSD